MQYIGLDAHQESQWTFCVLDENGKKVMTLETVHGSWKNMLDALSSIEPRLF